MAGSVRASLLLRCAALVTLGASIAAGQQAATTTTAATATAPKRGGNPEAAKILNPVVASPESTSAGKRAYTQLCANCHGPTGRGDGRGATAGTQPADLTDATWDYGATDGEIFAVIHDGVSTEMGPYAERMKDSDIWNVINYIRSLAPKP